MSFYCVLFINYGVRGFAVITAAANDALERRDSIFGEHCMLTMSNGGSITLKVNDTSS